MKTLFILITLALAIVTQAQQPYTYTGTFDTTLISATATTTGTIAAARDVTIIIRSGTLQLLGASGTTSFTSTDNPVRITAPTSWILPAIVYTIPTSGTAILNTIR